MLWPLYGRGTQRHQGPRRVLLRLRLTEAGRVILLSPDKKWGCWKALSRIDRFYRPYETYGKYRKFRKV